MLADKRITKSKQKNNPEYWYHAFRNHEEKECGILQIICLSSL